MQQDEKSPVGDDAESPRTETGPEESAAPSEPAKGPKSAESPTQPRRRRPGSARRTFDLVRRLVARLVWLVCVVAALALAVGALLVVVDANRDNALVKAILDLADIADLGVFDRDNGIITFTGADADTKNALVNWGIGALVWLIVGRLLDRLIRP